jgi:hypothetical protein
VPSGASRRSQEIGREVPRSRPLFFLLR